jgi:GrpB-like predicted nucleotidyltransferase (UPF0157 family)
MMLQSCRRWRRTGRKKENNQDNLLVKKQRTIIIVDYDPQWPLIFARLQRMIAAALGDLAISIEHVGSTSVPALAAKPIIDIQLVIQSSEQFSAVKQKMELLGYFHEPHIKLPFQEAFGREDDYVPRDGSGCLWMNQHLYVSTVDSPELIRQLAFRDYLRTHPTAVLTYAKLKRELAQRYPHDIANYVDGKGPFVNECIRAMNIYDSK